MKVKELMEKLKQYNPEYEVMYWDAEESRHYPALITECRRNMLKHESLIVEIDREG